MFRLGQAVKISINKQIITCHLMLFHLPESRRLLLVWFHFCHCNTWVLALIGQKQTISSATFGTLSPACEDSHGRQWLWQWWMDRVQSGGQHFQCVAWGQSAVHYALAGILSKVVAVGLELGYFQSISETLKSQQHVATSSVHSYIYWRVFFNGCEPQKILVWKIL